MLEIRKVVVTFNENNVLELERIVIDSDEKEALNFLKKVVYSRIAASQQGRLKSHLDTGVDPVKDFVQDWSEPLRLDTSG